jgi:NAD(P)-dependent dehydrogenase (short-subunit alcohol dehydrogenase family)
MDINGAVAIVTGGASGLGRATVERLAKQGARVHAFDLAFDEGFNDARPGTAHVVDVCDSETITSALDRIYETDGHPSILVNAAGKAAPFKRTYGRNGPFSLDVFQQILEINLVGSFNCARLVAEHMAQRETTPRGERGVIIHVASINAFDAPLGTVAYTAAKAGVSGMTLAMARDLAPVGVRVCCIAPGSFETPMLMDAFSGDPSSLLETVPFPNDQLGDPDEFAFLVEHICQNPMLNGETIRLDAAARLK